MSDPQNPPESGRPPIADAASLFDSNVVQAYNPPPDPEPPSSVTKLAGEGASNEYGLAAPIPAAAAPRVPVKPAGKSKPVPASRHFDPTDDDDEPPSRAQPASRSDSSIRAERASRHDMDAEADSSDRIPSRSKRRSSERAIGFEDEPEAVGADDELGAEVDPIWSRGAEWGPDLFRIAVVGVVTLAVAWFALGVSVGLAALVVLLGGTACVLLSYPLAITIERPVRITPEQAVTDFFAAASHHLPHYRRMWLLLSPTARTMGRFQSFGAFRSNWQSRMAGWKHGKGGTLTPLTFQVGEFRGDKSVGQSIAHVEYTVQVFVRGHEQEKPINSYRMAHGLVRGPDRMWYLNQGTLATAR